MADELSMGLSGWRVCDPAGYGSLAFRAFPCHFSSDGSGECGLAAQSVSPNRSTSPPRRSPCGRRRFTRSERPPDLERNSLRLPSSRSDDLARLTSSRCSDTLLRQGQRTRQCRACSISFRDPRSLCPDNALRPVEPWARARHCAGGDDASSAATGASGGGIVEPGTSHGRAADARKGASICAPKSPGMLSRGRQ